LIALRFYLDENVPTEVARQLRLSGIDAVSARDVGRLSLADHDHLRLANDEGRVFCTHDHAADGTRRYISLR